MSRRLAAIMFTDIAGYTSLSQIDEPAALGLLQDQERLARGLLEVHQGRLVKSIGDGLLIEFANARNAVMCAVDLQRHILERNAQEPPPALRVRIGIHLGDVQGAGSDILGDAVNIAFRIEPLAEPGGICLSESVYVQVRNKVSFPLEKLGSKTLKGVQMPMEVYRVVLPSTAEKVASPAIPRIAVLPFANISPDPKDEYFADGLTEELITVLSQLKGLRVVSRTSVNQYKGTTKSVGQIGSELGADSVLEGSVRKAGDQLRITVQLIDPRTDEHRWAQTYDRQLENVFAIQAEVAERTAISLKVELLKSEREAIQERRTPSLIAYESYLRGIRAVQTAYGRMTARADREIAKYFEAAIREDSGFSAAYSQLANHLIVAAGETRPVRIAFARARKLVVRALELNPTSSDAHMARGTLAFQADLDWARAESEYQQAIALNPSSSAAHLWYAHLLSTLQRFREAEKQTIAATELDPLWFLLRQGRVWNEWMSGDYGRAVALGEKLIAEFSDHPYALSLLAWQYARAGRTKDAVNLAKPLVGSPDMSARVQAGGLLAFLGDRRELLALVTEIESGRRTGPPDLAQIASIYSFCGEKEKALTLLEQDSRSGDKLLWNHYQEPCFDPIRSDPRFVALIRAMNLPTTLSRPLWSGKRPPTLGSARSKSYPPGQQAPPR